MCIQNLNAQVSTGGATTANHQKQIIGYITNWDAWKTTTAGVPAQGALNHLNIDYSKYTVLNYSFFGVAVDGSLHSGDYRNKNIYMAGTTQAPADIFFTDTYSSWDLHLLFGELDLIQYINADVVTRAKAQGFDVQVNGTTWSNSRWGLTNKPLPLPLHKEGGAPGILELAHQKGVKVVASIGGWSMCKHFPEMAADPVKRQRFINDCKKLINTGFDGIDLDWEFVGPFSGMNLTGTQADFVNFTTLVQEIRNAIGPDKLVTAAMPADPAKLQGFEWTKLNATMNYYNIMTYDYNGGWSDKAGHNSPLNAYDGAEVPQFNWQASFDKLMALGVPKNKITMGSPFYGRGVITNGNATINAPTVKRNETVQPDGPISTCADYTNWPKDVYDGTPNYFFIKQVALGAGSGWTRNWDAKAKVPYITKGNYLLSYDDEESIGNKAQFIVDNGLAGTIVWTVYGDLEMSGSPTRFGSKLIRYPNVKSVLVNKLNEVFANGSVGLPIVNITNPANGSNVAPGANVVVDATATDAGGSITKVEFFLDAVKVGEDATSPYSVTITNIASGTHSISAKATDNSGNTATASVSITASSNTPPTVSITSPANGASFNSGTAVNITATAADTDGTVSLVEFFQGATKIGEDATSPYSINWNNSVAGNYSLTAKATDNVGATATSTPVTITIVGSSCTVPAWDAATVYLANAEVSRNGNKYQAKWWTQGQDPLQNSGTDGVWKLIGPCGNNLNPTGSITSPINNATFTAPATVLINATATDADGTVTKVEFFQGTTKLGEDLTNPYSFNWTNVPSGVYSLTIKITDNAGGIANSAVVSITVSGGSGTNPTVSLTAPANNSTYTAPASITISANASDVDGTINKVDFYNGTTLLGTDATSPYSFTWANVAAGTFSITAKATDNQGLTATSTTVTVVVSNSSGGCSGIPAYVQNGGYAAGSIVQNAGSQYECRPYPNSGWCNGAAWAYAPGTGSYWQDAWILKGSCTTNAQAFSESSDLFGSNNLSRASGLSIYPNPGLHGQSSISLLFDEIPGSLQVKMVDLNGTIVFQQHMKNLQNKSISINPNNLSKGVFFLHIQGEKKNWIMRYQLY